MAIQRADPLRDLVQLKQTVNRMFDDALARSSVSEKQSLGAATWTPPLDLVEEPRRYVMRVDLPGVGPSDVEINVEAGRLTLRGQRRTDSGVPRDAYLRVERPSGPFTLQLTLPESVDAGEIHAQHANGVLEIVLPRRTAERPGRIEIASA
jgi:HSP20 family protein